MLHEINITGFSLFPLDSLSLQLHPLLFLLLNLLESLISEYLLRIFEARLESAALPSLLTTEALQVCGVQLVGREFHGPSCSLSRSSAPSWWKMRARGLARPAQAEGGREQVLENILWGLPAK